MKCPTARFDQKETVFYSGFLPELKDFVAGQMTILAAITMTIIKAFKS